ncbi:TPA: hypothetical protein DIC21_00430, partial [Candidatus Uhrbacteria bacterium]|nr:hypothetical protein [Candidatus Uhrbacteria bacterium]
NSYLYEGNTRLTNSRSINSTTREVTFSSLGLDFTNGETKYVTVRVDVAAAATVAAGDTVYFSLVEATDVVTDSEVSGNFPISGNTMTFSDTVAGTLTVIDNGTITNPTLGQEGATIAKVKFSAATEGASIEQVMFDVDNAADHSNFQLYDGTTLLANGTVVGKKVTFVFGTPYVIAKGGDETLQVKADIGGEANDVISVAIEESADVMATGSIYGFNMGIDVTGFDQTGNTNCTTECSESTVQGGDLTFAFNGPSASDIAVDSNDVILLNFTITSANWTELQNLPISLTVSGADTTADDNDLLNNTAADANYTDITVRLEDGTAWMGPEELTTLATGAAASALDQTQTLTFDDYQTLQAGESFDLMLTVDVGSDTDLNADIVYASIIMASVTADDINGDSLVVSTDVVPTSTITGYSMTITTSSLTVNESSTPWTSTYIKGSSAASLVGYNFTAGTSHDITVSDVTFTGTGDSDGTFSNENDIVLTDKISSCSVYDGVTGSLVDGPEGVIDTSSVYTIPFTDFAWNLEAGETSKLIMKCNLANVAPDGTDVYKFFIGATNSAPVVTAQDEEGDSVTACYDVDDDGGTCATDASDDLAYDSVAATVPTITIAAAGTLTVAASADMPTSTIILGSSTGVTVSKIKFTSTSEAWVINKMTFANASTTPSAAVSDSVAAGITVSYTNSDGDTETSSGFLSGASVTFSGLDVYVAKDSSATVTVTLDTAVVDSTSIDGATIDLDFDSSAASEFNAVGADSGDTFDGTELSGSDPSANAMTIYKTKPTLSLASGSPSGAGIPGLNEVFRFNVAADSRGYVTLNEVTFKMSSTAGSAVKWHYCDDDNSASGISDADLTLYDVLDLGTALEGADTNWTFYDSSDGSVCTEDTDVIDYIVLDLTTPDVIAAGTTLTYSLYMDNTGASAANDDSLRIDLDIDANSLAGTAAHVGTDGTICWDDDAYDTGLYATLVKTLPVTGGTIVY